VLNKVNANRRTWRRSTRSWALAFTLGLALVTWHTSAVQAQERARSGQAREAKPSKPARGRARANAAAPKVPAPAAKPEAKAPHAETAPPTGEPAKSETASPDEEGQIRTEGDTQVKVMEFSGLDIEGQLKTPQMLYFLNRLRAEFGRPRLPHRSFMPELQRSTRGKAF
jgi:hypothetical protein